MTLITSSKNLDSTAVLLKGGGLFEDPHSVR